MKALATYRAFSRWHKSAFALMVLLVAWCVFNIVTSTDGVHQVIQAVCALVDAGLAWLWWHWGVEDAERRADR